MREIGFEKREKEYIHPKCTHLFVEFPSGPLGIGQDYNIQVDEHKVEGTIIKILSPTDCIKDRLASFIHWNAEECLDQAVLVGQAHKYNDMAVKKWCEGEGALGSYKKFQEKLKEEL